MFLLFETIKCLDGKLYQVDWHTKRLNYSKQACFGTSDFINLAENIAIPETARNGLYRCRITYSTKIEKIEFIPHHFRKINSLKLVTDNNIDYSYKYSDRNNLEKLFTLKEDCDDILIVKNGCITDSFTANTVFYDGIDWWTPDTPLLPGTQRAYLISTRKIKECRITPKNIHEFRKAGLINVMWDLNSMPIIYIKDIII